VREIGKPGVSISWKAAFARSGNKVRVNVQLIDAANDELIWAEITTRFDGRFQDSD